MNPIEMSPPLTMLGSLFGGSKGKVTIPKLGKLQFAPNPHGYKDRFSDLNFDYSDINSLFQTPILKTSKEVSSNGQANKAYNSALSAVKDYFMSGVNPVDTHGFLGNNAPSANFNAPSNNNSFGILNPKFMQSFQSFMPKF